MYIQSKAYLRIYKRKNAFHSPSTQNHSTFPFPRNTVYYNIVPKLMKIYNNRYHSTIKMSPIKVNKNNEKYIKENIYTYNKTSKNPKFKIGDLVRISLKRRDVFDKPSSNIKWSEELFKIHSINKSDVITYKIKDLNNNIIEGIFLRKRITKN